MLDPCNLMDYLLQCTKVKSESKVTQSCRTLPTPWTAAYQAAPSMGFSRQEYWSGVPLPSPNLRLQPFQYMVDFQSYLGKMHVTVNFLRVKGVKGKSTTS